MLDVGTTEGYRWHSDRREKCPCPQVHPVVTPWAGSTRRSRLPPGWSSTITPRILARDQYRCYLCGAHATEVDHVVQGDDHRDSNLKAICNPCHKTKTAAEANAVRWSKGRMTRAAEKHPGLR